MGLGQIRTGLTFDDVLIVPRRSSIRSRQDVSVCTRLSRRIELGIPVVAANMDTVCEHEMAVAMARLGGIGFVHRFMPIEAQADQIDQLTHALFQILAPGQLVYAQGLADDVQNGLAGIKARIGVLKDHLHMAAGGAQLLGIETGYIGLAVVDTQQHLSFRRFNRADNAAAQRRFAAPRLADQPQGLPGGDAQAHIIDGAHLPNHPAQQTLFDGEILFEVMYFEQVVRFHSCHS